MHRFFSLKRLCNACGHSLSGLKVALQESAFRQELLLVIILIPIAVFLNVTTLSKVLLITSVFFILIAELINTAIETIINRISLEQNDLSKSAKDIGSAVVLLSFINAICIWSAILLLR